jgi:hypothetical protein
MAGSRWCGSCDSRQPIGKRQLAKGGWEQMTPEAGAAKGLSVTYLVKKVDPKVRHMQRRVTARLLRSDEKVSGTVP